MASRIACRKINSSENYVLGWISSHSCSYFLWNREFFKKENRPRPRLRVLLTPPRNGKMATRTWTYIKTSSFDTLHDKLCSVKIFHVYKYKGDSNEMESKLNWSSGVNLILTFKSVIYMFIAIVLGYENNSYTYKLHLYYKTFLKLTPVVVRDLVV